MKMYNEEGSEVYVEKDQMDIFLEAGWNLNPPDKNSEPSESKEVIEDKVVEDEEIEEIEEVIEPVELKTVKKPSPKKKTARKISIKKD
jgi:hypothetical protein